MESKPTHEQAQLHLQLYDQRREARLRQARDWFGKNYIVNNIDEAMRIAPMGSETGIYVQMVIGYWEQACALLNYGLLHEDLFFETAGEFFGVWEAIKPVVPARDAAIHAADALSGSISGKSLIPAQSEVICGPLELTAALFHPARPGVLRLSPGLGLCSAPGIPLVRGSHSTTKSTVARSDWRAVLGTLDYTTFESAGSTYFTSNTSLPRSL